MCLVCLIKLIKTNGACSLVPFGRGEPNQGAALCYVHIFLKRRQLSPSELCKCPDTEIEESFCCGFPGYRMLGSSRRKGEKKVWVRYKESAYLDSVNQTRRHFTAEHNECCDVDYPLSIVRVPETHPVLSHNTCPLLLLEKTE